MLRIVRTPYSMQPGHRPRKTGDVSDHPVTIMWFRRDLRVDDHPALAAAAERGDVVALWVADPALLGAPHHRSPVRMRFLRACLEALDAELTALGIPLIVRHGAPALVLPHRVYPFTGFFCIIGELLHRLDAARGGRTSL